MKKRRAMALILAAALALPNTGVAAGIVGGPVTVEAAAQTEDEGVVTTVPQITFGGVPDKTASTKDNESTLQLSVTEKVLPKEGRSKVGDVISIDPDSDGWELLNASEELKQGNENTAKLKYTFAKDTTDVTGNGWEKDSSGAYYGVFDVKFEVVKEIAPETVIDESKWPKLTEKEYLSNTATYKDYWKEELEKYSNPYGTFSLIEAEDTVGNVGSKTVTVVLTLNPGYIFTADSINGLDVPAKSTKYNWTQTVNVKQQVISKIEWPKITVKPGQTIEYGANADATLTTTPASAGGVNFTIRRKNKTALGAYTLEVGANDFQIEASPVDTTNFIIEENNKFKEERVNVDAPSMTEVVLKARKPGEVTATTPSNDSVNVSPGSGNVVLSVDASWSPSTAGTHYILSYQWYNESGKIQGATGSTYQVNDGVAGQYYCEVSATFDKTHSLENSYIYKDQPAKSTQKVNVAFSNIALSGAIVKENPTGTYGSMAGDAVYRVPINGLTNKAEMSLVVKDADGKEITSDMISGKAGPIEGGATTYIITVNKNADAGTYFFTVKVKDGNNTVAIADVNDLKCVINKASLNVVTTQIKQITKDLVHGDPLSKLAGFEYVAAGSNPTTDEKREAKNINDKVKISVKDWKNSGTGFTTDYFVKTTTKTPLVTVELVGDKNKKNYVLGGDLTLSLNEDGIAEISVPVEVGAKQITLGVEAIEMVKGESLPKRTITGQDTFLAVDKIDVAESGSWYLIEKNDKSQTPIKNSVKSLDAGNYILVTHVMITSATGDKVQNYEIKKSVVSPGGEYDPGVDGDEYEVRGELTIYESEHVVGYVTYGDTAPQSDKVEHGKTLTKPADPTREGYKFLGWYTDKDYTKAYDFALPVKEDITLYAKWEKVSTPSQEDKPGATVEKVKKGTIVETGAGAFAVTNVSQKTVNYKAADKSATTVAIPSSVVINGTTYKVTGIAATAFRNCKSLTKVTIPTSVTTIGTDAFRGCAKLTSITIPKSVTKIGQEAFSGCKALKTVTIKSTKIKAIGGWTFENCKKLTKITIPSSVTSIGAAAFKNCTSLTSITVPKNVTKIGKNAFLGCSKLKTVTIKSTKLSSVGANAFKKIAAKSVIKTPSGKKAAYTKILKKAGYKNTVK